MRESALLALALAGCTTAAVAPVRQALAVADELPLGALPAQQLAKGECAVFLWKAGDNGRLLLVARSTPPVARVMLDGTPRDLPRTEAGGEGQTHTVYADATTTLTLDLTIEQKQGLADGALVSSGSLALDRTGADGVVVPVAGLVGCER